MNKQISGLYAWAAITVFGLSGFLVAEEAIGLRNSPAQAGAVFRPVIGQPTNMTVSAREVTWVDTHGSTSLVYVVFAKEAREAIVCTSTNQVAFLDGKLFAVSPGIQSIWVSVSQALEATDLTAEHATDLAIKAVYKSKPGENATTKLIDLRPFLEKERDLHLAQMLILRSAALKAERGQLVVSFESQTGLHGTAILSTDLNLVSAKVSDPPQK